MCNWLPSAANRTSNGWRQLESALKKALKEMPVPANPRGISLVFLGVLMLGLIAYGWPGNPWPSRGPWKSCCTCEGPTGCRAEEGYRPGGDFCTIPYCTLREGRYSDWFSWCSNSSLA